MNFNNDLLHRFDQHHALKPNWLFWVTLLYELKMIMLSILHFFFVQHEVDILGQLKGLKAMVFWYWLAALPSLCLLGVSWLRRPNSPKWVGWLWARGRLLLFLGLIADLALNTARLFQYGIRLDTLTVAFSILGLWLLLLVLTNQYFNDLFASMPENVDKF